jgi:3-dehydroquinate dehydratase-2
VKFLTLHGPNLNLLGTREPALYGHLTLEQIDQRLQAAAREAGVELRTLQSNHEGALIDAIHDARQWATGIIINPGALGHYSYALRDALGAAGLPAIEVHISNIYARDAWRRHSVLSEVVAGSICGLGWRGYLYALEALIDRQRDETSGRR